MQNRWFFEKIFFKELLKITFGDSKPLRKVLDRLVNELWDPSPEHCIIVNDMSGLYGFGKKDLVEQPVPYTNLSFYYKDNFVHLMELILQNFIQIKHTWL